MSGRRGSWKVAVVLGTTGLLLWLGARNLGARASVEVVDDGVFWQSQEGRVVAKRIDPEGPAARAGLRKGDVLVALDGEPVDEAREVRHRLESAAPGQRFDYQILRERERRALSLAVEPVRRGHAGLYYFLATVGIFSLLVGTVVYVRRRGARATAHFYLLCVFWYLAYAFSPTGRMDGWDFAFYWLDRIGVLFFPPVFLHFALCFPERKELVDRHRWVLAALYVPSFLLLYGVLLAKLLFFVDVPWGDRLFVVADRLVDRILPAYVAAMSLAGLWGFVDSYRRARTIAVKKQTKWIVWGTAFGTAPFALFYAVPYLVGVRPTLAMELSVVPLALVPLAFAYAIVKYRLMDVEVIFKRGVVYTLATAAAIGLYLAIFVPGTHYLVGDSHSLVIALLATMVVVLLFTPIKSRIQVAIDRMFYRERYDYRRALLAFSRDLNADLDLDRLAQRLVERVADTFEVEKVALLVPQEGGEALGVAYGVGLSDEERKTAMLSPSSALLGRLLQGEIVFYGEYDWRSLDDSGEIGPANEAAPLIEGLQYAIPCLAQGRVVGVLLLGRRWDQSALSSEDLELLQTLSGQAATALENARLYRSLERKAEQFERLKEHSERTIESLDTGILVLDLDGKVVRWNRALERLYGVARDEALGRTLDELFPQAVLDVLTAAVGERWWERGETTGVSRLNLHTKRGEPKVVKLRLGPFVADSGEIQGTIVIFEDITERVELETQLRLREKMASLGLLAAGVAHEVNTPLTGISSFAQMLERQIPADDPRRELLEKIERQTERASKIVNNLLNFARQGRTDFVPVDINEVVEDVLSLLEHQLRRGRIKVRLELDRHLPRMRGDENKLQQVFLNLVLNAQDAMPAGGWLTIRTSQRAGQIVVEVADTGHGIDKEDIKRIYDPFFTTKTAGRSGTGLGLAITYGIVQEHSGQISVKSVVGKGTRFTLTFPVHEDERTGEAARVSGERSRQLGGS